MLHGSTFFFCLEDGGLLQTTLGLQLYTHVLLDDFKVVFVELGLDTALAVLVRLALTFLGLDLSFEFSGNLSVGGDEGSR